MITSVGYAGTVSDSQWAEMVPHAGSFYSVDNYASLRVTAAVGTRTVAIAPGGASGHGVYDESSSVETLALGSVPSGIRWDLIVLRRTWGTKLTTLAVVPGGSAKALPNRANTPGVLDEQPLALVRVAAGQTTIQEIVDVRVTVNNGGALAWDDLARSYMDQLGTNIRIGALSWSRVTDAAGNVAWVSSNMHDTGWVAVTRGPGWGAVANYPLLVRSIGLITEIRGAVLAANAQASVLNLGTVPSAFRLSGPLFLGPTHSGRDRTFHGELHLSESGVIGVPDAYYSGSLGLNGVVPVHGLWLRG